MAKQTVLVLGAHGETGGDILEGLLKDGNFEVSALVQPSSVDKPAVKALVSRNISVVIADLQGPLDALVKAIKGYDTIISCIGPHAQLAQLPLVDAAAQAGTKRFVPCGFITVCPPHGVMKMREAKEAVYNRIWYHHLPYTIIDVGFWHQISVFRVPSGKFDYALAMDNSELYGDGEAKTLLTDKRDIGRFVARIVKDPRTINQKVFTWSDELSQNEIVSLVEKKTGEQLQPSHITAEQLNDAIERADAALEKDAGNAMAWLLRTGTDYNISKYIREDNTREGALYLGYLDAKELYPDLKPITFEEFVDELNAGKATRPYEETAYKMLKQMEDSPNGLFVIHTTRAV